MKKLLDMTLQELWKLFPIFLTEHKEYWSDWFLEEKENLLRLIPFSVEIHHIGSTAIVGIWAKPIVDILIETENETQLSFINIILQENGYLLMSQSGTRCSLNKGYTERGFAEKVFHVHVRLKGDTEEIYFRDYLIEHPYVAKAYERLKLDLWKRYGYDRDAYTQAKTEFVLKYTKIGKVDKNREV